MKKFMLTVIIIAFLFGLTLILFGCNEEPKQVYETEIKTYLISFKEIDHVGGKIPHDNYIIYFQTQTSTEKAIVNVNTYNKYQVGDTIQVLIKYWEKPKKK